MSHSRSKGISIALLVLVVLFATYQNGRQLIARAWLSPTDIAKNDVARLDAAFGVIRTKVPDDGLVGFKTNKGVRELYLTQFCLAPRRVLRDSVMNVTVGMFKDIDSVLLDSLATEGFRHVDTVVAYQILFREAP